MKENKLLKLKRQLIASKEHLIASKENLDTAHLILAELFKEVWEDEGK